ncbi:MAG: cation-translocating P-type ATPase [Bacillota bacterium]|nr:cation-translocating P-type ATPase [Bacillota bacterium]
MYYHKSIAETESALQTDLKQGLTSAEAAKRLEQYGENRLAEPPKKNVLQIFLAQLNDALIYVLLTAAVVTAFIGEFTDSIIILIVVLINASIGVFQEYKADRAVEDLKMMTSPLALVRRDGQTVEIDSREIVPGDVVLLEAGRYVLADLRITESANLQIEEASLTGESLPSDKKADLLESESVPLGDQSNMAFLSTLVTYGRGTGIAIGTGMNTEIGKIATMLNAETDSKTPLQIQLDRLGKRLGILALIVCAVIGVIGYFQGREPFDLFLTAISLAVAAIPEGLAAIVAIVLALGITRMTKKNAIVKKLTAVETLGSVDIVCSDKTGTLTQNRMKVVATYTYSTETESDVDVEHPESAKLMQALMLASDATYADGVGTGDPTEVALIELGKRHSVDHDGLIRDYPRRSEFPFDSERKRMSTLHENSGETDYIIYTKGAIDQLIETCTHVLIGSEVQPLTEEVKQRFLDCAYEYSTKALRVLAAAYKHVDRVVETHEMESDLTLIGLVGMIDPPRIEVKPAIERARQAGITTIMITGDHKVTAFAIAKELGIATNISQAITGAEIDKMSDSEWETRARNYRIFARVSPEHKVKIIKAFKSYGNTVSMTGDGVNDAPSLKFADIGVAMGITGTDVSKSSSDMILLDDNFTTIIVAIEEGRNIFENIKKAVIFLLTCNFGEVVSIVASMLLNWAIPLIPTQILWINLITDSLPAIALGVDPGDEEIMKRPPRNKDESFFNKRTIATALLGGLLIGGLTLSAFAFGILERGYHPLDTLPEEVLLYARTMAFLTLAASQLFFSLSMRSDVKSIFRLGLFGNRKLIGAIVVGILLQLVVIVIPPLASAFKLVMLPLRDWLIVLGVSLIPFAVHEVFKKIRKHQ